MSTTSQNTVGHATKTSKDDTGISLPRRFRSTSFLVQKQPVTVAEITGHSRRQKTRPKRHRGSSAGKIRPAGRRYLTCMDESEWKGRRRPRCRFQGRQLGWRYLEEFSYVPVLGSYRPAGNGLESQKRKTLPKRAVSLLADNHFLPIVYKKRPRQRRGQRKRPGNEEASTSPEIMIGLQRQILRHQ
jgi:hypothetical protein